MNVFKVVASWAAGFFDKRLWAPIGGRETTSSETVSEDTALNYSAVWCATRLLCGTASSLPFPLYRGLDDEQRTKDRAHPVGRVLNRTPNPEQTAFSFRSVMWQWQVNWGNAFAEIVRELDDPDGELVALWPIHPNRVTVSRDDDNGLYYEVRDERTGEKVPVDAWRILHIPSIITADGITGRGVVEHARESIGAGIAAEKYGAHWFGGAAVPRVAIEHPGQWNEESRTAFRKEWDEIYSGPAGHRVALIQGGAKITPLSLSAEDSQFLETRQFGVEEIARWYGIPPHMLQHLLRATFNNVEHLGINFVQYSLIPWLRIWEQCVSQKLLTEREREEYFAEHNVDALMRGDSAARSSFYQTMTASALMTRNEVRKLENLDPVEGGDTFLVQGAMVPLDDEGRPESKFTETGATQAALPEPADDGDEARARMSLTVQRILHRDLSWILTKERKAMLNYAKKPTRFVDMMDSFYVSHSAFVGDAVTDTLTALAACGPAVKPESFVASWIVDGKSLMLEAAGTATPDALQDAVQSVVDSRNWSDRPVRAIEGVTNATVDI